jgi:SAM-dependent methyltransferase
MMPTGPYNIASSFYGRYRPRYPVELIDFIIGLAANHDEYVDLGCGTGALLFEVASHFKKAVGVDVDDGMLQQATASRLEVERKNVVLIEQKAEDYLARRRTSLDLVTAGRSIHWMDQPLVIRRAYELLKPNGVFALVGDRVSLWDRASGPFRAIRELITKFEGTKACRHLPAGETIRPMT